MLLKEAWVVKLLGTHLSIQVHEKVKFLRRDISSLAVKGLIIKFLFICLADEELKEFQSNIWWHQVNLDVNRAHRRFPNGMYCNLIWLMYFAFFANL